MAVTSGGFTDLWRGSYWKKPVAIKAFRTFPTRDLKDVQKVRGTAEASNHFDVVLVTVDPVEGCRSMEETIS
jgi:hypothetical protein